MTKFLFKKGNRFGFKKGQTPWNKDKRLPQFSGKNNPFFGKKHHKKTKRKMSEAQHNRKDNKGERHHSWKGGIMKDKKYVSWLKNKRNRQTKAGGHTWNEWETLKAQYNWTCLCCKKQEPKIKLTLDHIIPLSKGGSDNIENIQPLCGSCNSKKHTKNTKYG